MQVPPFVAPFPSMGIGQNCPERAQMFALIRLIAGTCLNSTRRHNEVALCTSDKSKKRAKLRFWSPSIPCPPEF